MLRGSAILISRDHSFCRHNSVVKTVTFSICRHGSPVKTVLFSRVLPKTTHAHHRPLQKDCVLTL